MDYTLLHLKGPRCSGRAVRIQELSPDAKDDVMLMAAKAVGPDATMLDLKKREWKMGVLAMVKMVSEPTQGDPNGADVKWKSYSHESLEAEYSTLFNAKDHGLLCAAFRSFHEVTEEEVSAIVGKALAVSVD